MSARAVFDMAECAGFHFNLLDIGGGFPGQASVKPSFEEVRCVGVCLLTDTLRADTEWHIKVLPLVAVSKKNCHVIHTVVW